VSTTVYTYDELSSTAKEMARDWWLSCMDTEDYTESVIEDAGRVAECLGIEFETRPVKLMNGSTRPDPCVYWSGFWSQGDGASFTGWYKPQAGAVERILAYARRTKFCATSPAASTKRSCWARGR